MRVYSPEPMAEYIARLKETAPQTLKDQITASDPCRYRFEGMVHALLHKITIECSIKNLKMSLRNHDTKH